MGDESRWVMGRGGISDERKDLIKEETRQVRSGEMMMRLGLAGESPHHSVLSLTYYSRSI
jgi:hypothetical protein